MPKLKMPPDKYQNFQILVRGAMKYQGVTQADVAAWFGCCRQTVNYKLLSPDLLTLGEINKLASRLRIPADEMRHAIPF